MIYLFMDKMDTDVNNVTKIWINIFFKGFKYKLQKIAIKSMWIIKVTEYSGSFGKQPVALQPQSHPCS